MDVQISLSGYVGNDIDFTEGDGWNFARFRLATTPRVRRANGWADGETTWISVRCAGRLARNVRDSISKGDPVLVVGRVRTRRWVATSGENREELVVEAYSVGHDLVRGVSMFRKNPRRSYPAETGEIVEAINDSVDSPVEAPDTPDADSPEEALPIAA
jgi:single-strand DNA-binding protein